MQLILDYIDRITHNHKGTGINTGLHDGDNLNHNLFIYYKKTKIDIKAMSQKEIE